MYQGNTPPHYPFPWRIGLALLRDALLGRSRSFRTDAQQCLQILKYPPKILHSLHIPAQGPALVVTNHYSRPSFPAWWIALAISATIPLDVHWLMTSAWNHIGPLTLASRWLFPRLARVYGFTPIPPMPPSPAEVVARAQTVRKVLRVARKPHAVIGLAPEGRDHPGGVLGDPPPGSGRFIQHLLNTCNLILPVGVYEDQDGLCVQFGSVFELAPVVDPDALDIDTDTSRQVMSAIARQLPESLRGVYGC